MRLLLALMVFATPVIAQDGLPGEGQLLDLTMGDYACYVDLELPNGEFVSFEGDFALCETDALIGKDVEIYWAEAKIYAASCEGNMDCTDYETVWIVESLLPTP